jgi:signal transduction histidine kinase/tetratricopeptide (TPR) repeat protein
MFGNLKIALKRQKKLIIIFLLTIFLPSIALSIFGIRAIRNERFRLVQQLEDEHGRAAAFLKSQIDSRFEDVEFALQNLAQTLSFREKNYASVKEALNNKFRDDPLIELVFLAYKDEEPLFPLILPVSPIRAPAVLSPINSTQSERLEKAQRMEFGQKNFSEAVLLYEQVFSRSEDRDVQARMLNNMARCYTKLKNYEKAIQCYYQICEKYPQCLTSSSLPLDLIAKIQIVKCCRNKGDHEIFISNALELYRNILRRQWPLNADQFNTYASMVEKDLSNYLSMDERDSDNDGYAQEFEQLKELRHKLNEQWDVVKNIKSSILPELQRRLSLNPDSAADSLRHSRTINQKDYLVVASAVSQGEKEDFLGLLGVKIDDVHLISQEVNKILDDFPFSQEVSFSLSNLSGRILSEYGNPSLNNSTYTAYFEESFPPWKIDFFSAGMGESGVIDLRKSFYFWTILTVLVLLTFGTVLVVRTVAHEMEVLRVKSDFVSSVSHEFKTPITAIKTSIERLQHGKVKTPDKMKEYYSIISKDADKLSSLVRNILDYSKVDAGRKQYFFQETDLAQLVKEEIGNFERDKIFAGIKIDTKISSDIPDIDIDREGFSLALNNLLENAAKFSPGRRVIFVEVRKEAESVRVDVKDLGMGIDPGEMDKIFDKFYQGKNAARQSFRGTGLGLTLVKHVMDAHGGKVEVKSKIGKGSTFSLIFPIRQRGSKL